MSFDAYLKFDNGEIKGESTATGFADAMDIFSFSWGVSNAISVGTGTSGLGASKAHVSSFNFMKRSDAASPVLFAAATTGKPLKKVTVTLRKAGGDAPVNFIKYEFDNCMIESLQWSGSSGGDDTPTESVSIAFTKATVTYTSQGNDQKAGKPIIGMYDIQKVAAK